MQCGCKKISVFDFSNLIIHTATVGQVSEFNFKKKTGFYNKKYEQLIIYQSDECFCSVLDRFGWSSFFFLAFLVAEP